MPPVTAVDGVTVSKATWSCSSMTGAKKANKDKMMVVKHKRGARYKVTALERPAIMIVEDIYCKD